MTEKKGVTPHFSAEIRDQSIAKEENNRGPITSSRRFESHNLLNYQNQLADLSALCALGTNFKILRTGWKLTGIFSPTLLIMQTFVGFPYDHMPLNYVSRKQGNNTRIL